MDRLVHVVPNTGPRPASSTPNTHSVDMSSAICCGMGEKCEYDLPERTSSLWIEGAMKTLSGGVSCSMSCVSISTSSTVSAMLIALLVDVVVKLEVEMLIVKLGRRDACWVRRDCPTIEPHSSHHEDHHSSFILLLTNLKSSSQPPAMTISWHVPAAAVCTLSCTRGKASVTNPQPQLSPAQKLASLTLSCSINTRCP